MIKITIDIPTGNKKKAKELLKGIDDDNVMKRINKLLKGKRLIPYEATSPESIDFNGGTAIVKIVASKIK